MTKIFGSIEFNTGESIEKVKVKERRARHKLVMQEMKDACDSLGGYAETECGNYAIIALNKGEGE